jgi:phage shock protein PspC (stress-responsive transcriptional regulator)
MHKVISINLNGNAYQLEEAGFEALREYLAGAERELEGNPDRTEIVADLEQAIADKCQRFLGPHKSVVTAAEVTQIVDEMGPVTAGASAGSDAAADNAGEPRPKPGAPTPPKRLYRMTDGAMIAGVCNGLAALFQIDVTLVRIGFVVAALITQGVGILAYVVMMFVIPEANTPEERAAAGGLPFNAREVVDRVKREYAKGSRKWHREWRRHQRHWRQQQREWQRMAGPWTAAPGDPPPAWSLIVLPVFSVLHVTLFLVAAAMMISLVNTGGILTWRLPEDVPLWAAALILLVGYQIVASPFRAVAHWAWRPGAGGAAGWLAFWHAVVWLIGLSIIVWMASNNIPEITEFLLQLPHLFREFAYAIRDFFRP